MYTESEKQFASFENAGAHPSVEQKFVIWEQVRLKVQNEYEKQSMEQIYSRARNQIREELGFLALDPSLVPTSDEIEKLRGELLNLDQMKLKYPNQD
ncbi:MAG: hypothetical protein M3494_03985 [Actinomycetota bacterium]|jgi:hypothetical protein|nr:hypothetical protein [Rubrobacter sp.]MDQ3507165.1 hypothetical protein [Actinomycetota bacterium]